MLVLIKRKTIYKLIIIITFIFLILSYTCYFLKYDSIPVLSTKKVIIIDAGHGGRDPGAVFGKIYEKNINLDVAKRVYYILKRKGIKTYLTRSKDTNLVNWKNRGSYQRTSLWKRIIISRRKGGSVLISIHCNSNRNKRYYGPQTFYYQGSKTGKKLADLIQSELVKLRPTRRKAIPGDYYLLKYSHCTSVIIELGYLSNYKDRRLLNSPYFRQRLAEAIARGLLKFY